MANQLKEKQKKLKKLRTRNIILDFQRFDTTI